MASSDEIVEVVLVRTEVGAPALARLATLLSGDERARIERRRHDEDRRRDTVARALLRVLLGRRLGRDPRSLQFRAGEFGKPALTEGEWRFNVSHSGRLVVVALARREIGVDVERVQRSREILGLAGRLFLPAEIERLRAAPDPTLAFYDLWTAKEAVVKATGKGMSLPLRSFEVPALTSAPQPVRIDDPLDAVGWSVARLEVDDDHRAAVAAAGCDTWRVAMRWEDLECDDEIAPR